MTKNTDQALKFMEVLEWKTEARKLVNELPTDSMVENTEEIKAVIPEIECMQHWLGPVLTRFKQGVDNWLAMPVMSNREEGVYTLLYFKEQLAEGLNLKFVNNKYEKSMLKELFAKLNGADEASVFLEKVGLHTVYADKESFEGTKQAWMDYHTITP